MYYFLNLDWYLLQGVLPLGQWRRQWLNWGSYHKILAQVVKTMDSTIHQINHSLVDTVDSAIIGFLNTYPLDSGLYDGERYNYYYKPTNSHFLLAISNSPSPALASPFQAIGPSACHRASSHDVTAAILVFQNNETAALLVFQTNPVGVGLFSYVTNFFCCHKICIDVGHVSEYALYNFSC